jgi:protein-L-isoaspartate(D-aspartate) O-methyltransferase
MRIEEAFLSVPRENFLPAEIVGEGTWDVPLPIGFDQTNSQPTTVRLMLGWLQAEEGQKVLDLGSGSGWTTALLARIVGPEGRVVAVERIPELVKFGHENCKSIGIDNAEFHEAGRRLGWSPEAPYDRILVSAAAAKLPEELIEQLAPEGRMVIPVRRSVIVVQKDSSGKTDMREFPGFAFVPLVTA